MQLTGRIQGQSHLSFDIGATPEETVRIVRQRFRTVMTDTVRHGFSLGLRDQLVLIFDGDELADEHTLFQCGITGSRPIAIKIVRVLDLANVSGGNRGQRAIMPPAEVEEAVYISPPPRQLIGTDLCLFETYRLVYLMFARVNRSLVNFGELIRFSYDADEMDSIDHLYSMGFSLITIVQVFAATNGNMIQAVDILLKD